MDNTKNWLLDRYLSNLNVKLLRMEHRTLWPCWTYPPNTPGCDKFYYICNGEGQAKIENEEYKLYPGRLFFIPAGLARTLTTTNDKPITKYYCHFSSNYSFKNLFQSFKLPYFIEAEETSVLNGWFQKLVADDNSNSLFSFKKRIILEEIISYFFMKVEPEKNLDSGPSSLQAFSIVLDYIDNNLSHEISVKQLSDLLHIHPTYFAKLFKAYLGESPIHYAYKRRMEKAQYMLCNSDISIKEIAYVTGFNDPSHFSKSFRKFFGVSPKEYKNTLYNSDYFSTEVNSSNVDGPSNSR